MTSTLPSLASLADISATGSTATSRAGAEDMRQQAGELAGSGAEIDDAACGLKGSAAMMSAG